MFLDIRGDISRRAPSYVRSHDIRAISPSEQMAQFFTHPAVAHVPRVCCSTRVETLLCSYIFVWVESVQVDVPNAVVLPIGLAVLWRRSCRRCSVGCAMPCKVGDLTHPAWGSVTFPSVELPRCTEYIDIATFQQLDRNFTLFAGSNRSSK